jgi:hypothetical protein
MMLEELQRRNYSESTTRIYLRCIEQFARRFGKPPDQIGPEELRQYQAYLLQEKRIAPHSAKVQLAVGKSCRLSPSVGLEGGWFRYG